MSLVSCFDFSRLDEKSVDKDLRTVVVTSKNTRKTESEESPNVDIVQRLKIDEVGTERILGTYSDCFYTLSR